MKNKQTKLNFLNKCISLILLLAFSGCTFGFGSYSLPNSFERKQEVNSFLDSNPSILISVMKNAPITTGGKDLSSISGEEIITQIEQENVPGAYDYIEGAMLGNPLQMIDSAITIFSSKEFVDNGEPLKIAEIKEKLDGMKDSFS